MLDPRAHSFQAADRVAQRRTLTAMAPPAILLNHLHRCTPGTALQERVGETLPGLRAVGLTVALEDLQGGPQQAQAHVLLRGILVQ